MTDEKYRGSGSDPLSKRILNSIKPFSGEHTSKWLAALSTDNVKDQVVIQGGAEPAQEPPRSMAAWVDNLFDHFQRYAFDFSRMAQEPELQVNCTRPTVQDSKIQDNSVVTLGYLSTQQWALVVRGEFFRIQVYVVPVGVLMGFKLRHEEFPLYMEMIATQTARNKINWTLDNQPVSMDQSSALAKKLFAHLIMVARGEARDTDKFSLKAQTPESNLPKRPSSFDDKVELLKPEWLLEENPTPRPATPGFGGGTGAQSSGGFSSQELQGAPQFQTTGSPATFGTQPSAQQQSQYQTGAQPNLQNNAQYQTGAQPGLANSAQFPGAQANLQGNVQFQTGGQPGVPGNPQYQTGAQSAVGNPQYQTGAQSAVGNPQYQTGAQSAVGNPQYQAGAQPNLPGNPQFQNAAGAPGAPQNLPPQFPPVAGQNPNAQFAQGNQSLQMPGAPAFPASSAPSAPTAPAKLPSMEDLLQQNLVLVLNECNQFAGALDQQLEMLTPIGVKAIQNQDMDTASEIMQRAKKIKALLDAVVTFRNEWKDGKK